MDNRRHRHHSAATKIKTTGKQIVLTTFGSLGDLHPYIAIAVELLARGHRAVIATSENHRNHVQGAGIEFHPVRPNALAQIEKEWDFFRLLMDTERLTEYLICYLLMPHLRASYSDLMEAVQGADLLLTHPLTFTGSLVAQKVGIPWLLGVFSPSTLMSAYDIPNLASFPKSAYEQALELVAYDTQIRRLRSQMLVWTTPVQQLRDELGLVPDDEPMFAGDYAPKQVLALFSSALATPQPDWPPQTYITGFPFYDHHHHQGLSPELAKFLEAGSPPIVFTLGSAVVWTAGNFYVEAVAAVQQLGYRAVLLMGVGVYQLGAQGLPSGVMAVDYAPHGEIFPKAAAIVHHGGIGTTAEALRSGRPMLVVPYAYDQSDNAARVVRLGVARMISRQQYTTERLVVELKQLLGDPSYIQQSAQVAHIVQAEDGVCAACDVIEKYLYK